jgi:hypothetical protein
MERAPWLVVVLSSFVACGGLVAGQPSAPDAAPPVDAAPEAEGSLPDPRDPIACAGGRSVSYDKSCAATADCVVVTLGLGCCRSAALGCNAHDAARLADAGAFCQELDPCDCSGDAVTADDGRTSTAPHQSDVAVACTGGTCRSSVP